LSFCTAPTRLPASNLPLTISLKQNLSKRPIQLFLLDLPNDIVIKKSAFQFTRFEQKPAVSL
jgi:hypothetical protein